MPRELAIAVPPGLDSPRVAAAMPEPENSVQAEPVRASQAVLAIARWPIVTVVGALALAHSHFGITACLAPER